MPDAALGRFNRAIEKFFNVKGGPTVVDVSHQIMNVLPVDKGVDQRYLEGWNRFAVAAFPAALAGNFGRVRIRNPVGSNVIAVIEQIAFFTNTAADNPFVTWGATSTDLTNLAVVTFTRVDPRGNPQPVSIVSFVSQAAGGQALLSRLSNTTNTIDFINNPNQELPNLPGQAIDLQSTVANNSIGVTLMWRERALESSELT